MNEHVSPENLRRFRHVFDGFREELRVIALPPIVKAYRRCTINGCVAKHKAKGFCKSHYCRIYYPRKGA